MYSSINQSDQPNNLEINSIAKDYLYETAKWGRFLGIMGFIGAGFMVLFGIFYSSIWSLIPTLSDSMPYRMGFGFGLTVFYLLIGSLYFFPALYLFRYASKLIIAIQTSNSQELEEAFSNQKSLYKFMGIFTIVAIGFYVLALLIMLAGLGIGRLF